MGRIRTVKPDYFTDDRITECSVSARFLFIATWTVADDQGNLDRSAKQLKAKVFPHDKVDVEPLLLELIGKELLLEYEVDGQRYLHIRTFARHQRINRPSKPTCPAYQDSLRVQCEVTEPSPTEGKGKEGKGRELSNSPPAPPRGPRRREPVPPGSFEEVEAYARERQSPLDPRFFWDLFENGNPTWHDSKGNPVIAWKQKFCTLEKIEKSKRERGGEREPRGMAAAQEIIREVQEHEHRAQANRRGNGDIGTPGRFFPGMEADEGRNEGMGKKALGYPVPGRADFEGGG